MKTKKPAPKRKPTAKKLAPKKKPVPKVKKAPVKKKVPQWFDLAICALCHPNRFMFSTMTEHEDDLYCPRCIKLVRKKTPAAIAKRRAKKQKQIAKRVLGSNLPEPKPITKFNPSVKQWYAIQIYGNDNAVKKKILENARRKGLSQLVTRIVVPRIRVPITRQSGKVVFQNKKSMPGYILIHCMLSPDVKDMLMKTTGMSHTEWVDEETKEKKVSSKSFSVIRVLPYAEEIANKDKKAVERGDLNPPPPPSPLSQEEVERHAATPKKAIPIALATGDRVEIMQGNYSSITGFVKGVDNSYPENPTASVEFPFIGQPVRKSFQFSQLKKLS